MKCRLLLFLTLFASFAAVAMLSVYGRNENSSGLNSDFGPAEALPEESIVVIITPKGFEHDILTIPAGTSVTWINMDEKQHWPASDFHPTHTLYPDSGIVKCGTGEEGKILDACRGLEKGQNYAFTFTQLGKWRLHDHLNSGLTMQVEVVAEEKAQEKAETSTKSGRSAGFFEKILVLLGFKQNPNRAKAQSYQQLSAEEAAALAVEACSDTKSPSKSGKFACYAKQMESISYSHGAEFASEVLPVIQEADPAAKACHFIAHGIGWGSYKRNTSDWQNLIATSSPICSYGAQMGIIELHTQSLPDGKLAKKDVPDLCGPKPTADCNHAVGHMMMLEAKANLSAAIDLCSSLADKNQNYICLTGAFMERIIASNLLEHGLVDSSWQDWVRRLPLHEKLCRSLNGTYAVACWREIVHAAFYYFNKDPEAIFSYCGTAQLPAAARQCKLHSLPELLPAKGHNLTLLKGICSTGAQADQSFERQCYLSLVGIKLNSVAIKESHDAVSFCTSLGHNLTSACFERIGATLKVRKASEDEIKALCSSAPPEFTNACSGNGK